MRGKTPGQIDNGMIQEGEEKRMGQTGATAWGREWHGTELEDKTRKI